MKSTHKNIFKMMLFSIMLVVETKQTELEHVKFVLLIEDINNYQNIQLSGVHLVSNISSQTKNVKRRLPKKKSV